MRFEWPKSIGFNVALRVAFATTIVSVCLFAVIYAGLVNHGRKALLETIDADMHGMVDAYSTQGVEGLSHRIDERLALAPSINEKPIYMLRDPSGKAVAGNITNWPALNAATSESGRFEIAPKGWYSARVTTLRGGYTLLTGRSEERTDQILAGVRYLIIGGVIVMMLAGFFIGQYAARTLRGRINRLNDTFDAFADGQFARRADRDGPDDELKELSVHINAGFDRVDRLLKAQRDITDNIAHETRTPLMHLDSRIRTALQHHQDPEAEAALQNASSDIKGLLRLLDALLDIASAEAQKGDLRALSLINLSDVASGMADLYAASAEAVGLSLKAEITPDVMVKADAMQMSRLLVNLLDNALKYGAEGKEIRLKIDHGPLIVVEDEGQGIDDAHKDKVFERYMRATTKSRGHGLGLALTRAIAERHGWKIKVEDVDKSAKNRGARFVITPNNDTATHTTGD